MAEPVEQWTMALEVLLAHLLDNPRDLTISVTRPHPESHTVEAVISCSKVDVGRVIGKASNTITALRILTRAWAGKNHQEVILRVSGHVEPLSSLTRSNQ